VVTYQLISGRLPYEASSLSELALKQQRESPIPLDELNPEVPPSLAHAVALALAIDPRDRPADAMQLAEALREGARGIGPAGPPTRGFATGATRVLPGDPSAATRVSPGTRSEPTTAARAPRQVPARRPRPEVAAYQTADERQRPPAQSGRGFRRLMAVLALVAVLALIVIAAVTISNSTSNTVVHYKKIVAHDAQSAINQMRDLINQYTK
jgi:serine/threonine-protein kinase